MHSGLDRQSKADGHEDRTATLQNKMGKIVHPSDYRKLVIKLLIVIYVKSNYDE